jgi:hypothetical protein
LEHVLKSHAQLTDGTRICNLDETAASAVQKLPKVLTEKGLKQVSECTAAKRGTVVTTCCIVSTTGSTIPPVMIFQRIHEKQHITKDAPAGTLESCGVIRVDDI